MKSAEPSLKIYLASRITRSRSAKADSERRVSALLSFCIPDLAVMFRCRVVTSYRELTYTAAVTALRFVEKSMSADSRPERMTLLTDDPAFYFATEERGQPNGGDLLSQYRRRFSVEIQLVSRAENQARRASVSLPEAPLDVSPKLKLKKDISPKSGKMMPLQDGIDL
ncbi:MAG TPA: hypothetical protein VLB27_12315 [candidate division Zixibacteria bacterium]|nr:hypothetical protein [candidate division Zixibacteria bacterium]